MRKVLLSLFVLLNSLLVNAQEDPGIYFPDIVNVTYTDPPFELYAGSNHELTPITFESSDPNVISVSVIDGVWIATVNAAGTVTLTAKQAGAGNFLPGSVSQTIIVAKKLAYILFDNLENKMYGDGTFSLIAFGTQPIIFESSDPGVISVSNTTGSWIGTINGAGSATITAKYGGNDPSYLPNSVPRTITVAKRLAVISFSGLGTKTFGDVPFTLLASSSNVDVPVTYESSAPGIVSVSNSTGSWKATIIGAGTATITAKQTGNANYLAPASVARSITINKKSSTITFSGPGNKIYGDDPFDLVASSTSTESPVTFTSSSPSIITVSNSTGVWKGTIINKGSTSITASQNTSANFLAPTSVSRSVTINTPPDVPVASVVPSEETGQDYSPWLFESDNIVVKPTSGTNDPNQKYVDLTLKLTRKSKLGEVYLKAMPGDQQHPLTLYALNGTVKTLIGTYGSSAGDVDVVLNPIIEADGLVIHKYGNNTPEKVYPYGVPLPEAEYQKITGVLNFEKQADLPIYDDFYVNVGLNCSSNISDYTSYPITFTTSDPTIATIEKGNVLITKQAGSVTITASQAGNSIYETPQNASQTINILPRITDKLYIMNQEEVHQNANLKIDGKATVGKLNLKDPLNTSSVDSYEILTRNTSTGAIEKVSPTEIGGGDNSTYVSSSNNYINPTWLSSFAWNKLTGVPTTLADLGITDAVALTSDLSNLVHTSGNETISGIKSFNNNVGIGTAAPSTKLDIEGDFGSTGGQGIKVRNTNASGYSELVFNNNNAQSDGAFVFGYAGTSTSNANQAYFWNRRNAEILFGTNNVERLRITGSGNVGIGTTNPSTKLDLEGDFGTAGGQGIKIRNINAGGYSELVFNNNNADSNGAFVFGYAGTSTAYANQAYFWNRRNAEILFGTNNVERLRISGSGKVGIGTNNPQYPLNVVSSGVTATFTTNTNTSDALYVQSSTSNGFSSIGFLDEQNNQKGSVGFANSSAGGSLGNKVFLNANNKQLAFSVTGGVSYAALFDVNGNFGLGVNSPSSILHLKAGTAAAKTAPLKLTAGPSLATPEAGAVEFDGNRLYFTPSGERKTLAFTSDVSALSTDLSLKANSDASNINQTSFRTALGLNSGAYVNAEYANIPNTVVKRGAWGQVKFEDVFSDRGDGTGYYYFGPQDNNHYLSWNGTNYVLGSQGIIGTAAFSADNSFVHKTGNESITGIKTFSDQLSIGTSNVGTHKLSVGGSIHATAIKVDPDSWFDYIFHNTYKLPALADVEKYIQTNKHLPDVPSEAEVKKEGIELGEMSGILLKKIEELTLYMIEKDKQLEKANQRIDELAQKIESLQSKK